MKSILFSLFAMALLSVKPVHADHHEMHHEMMGHGVKDKLGLSDEQSSKFKSLMAPHHDAMKSLFEKKKAAMDKLRGQIEAKASDSDVQATLDSIKGIRSEMKAEQEKFQSAMAGILSPTQQAKMILAMGQKMRGWMGHGKKYEAGKSGAMRREMPPKRDDSSEVEDDD